MFLRKHLILVIALVFIVKDNLSQVNLQTGGIQFNIPLYSYQDAANRLSTGLSLVYTATNGLKVNDYSSEVGAGWNLAFGGVIERIQNGEPDDQKQDNVYDYPSVINSSTWTYYRNTYYPNGYLYSEYDPATPVINAGGYTPLFEYEATYKKDPIYLADREQDIFAFSFNGRSGTFLIGKNGTIRTVVDSKLKIEKVITNMTANNIRTRISEFQITDETGIKYIFKDIELSEVIEYDRQYGNISSGGWTVIQAGTIVPNTADFYTGTPKNQFIVNKWFLSEIINPLTNKKIVFTYETYNVDITAEKIGNYTVSNQATSVSSQATHTGFIQMRKKGVLKRIKLIKSSDKEEVEFTYSSTSRKDIPSYKAIEEISIKYASNVINRWKFEFGYFVENTIRTFTETLSQEEMYKSRLCLLKLCNTGKNQICTTPPYQFEYFIGTVPTIVNGSTVNLDYRVSPMFSYYQDHWGYSIAGTFITPNIYLDQPRNDISNSNISWGWVKSYAKNDIIAGLGVKYRDPYGNNYISGTLRIIKFPLGGSLQFEVEPNTAIKIGTSQEFRNGGCRVAKTITYDGIDHANDIIKEYKYITANNLTSGWGFEEPVYRNDITNRVYKCSYKKPGLDAVQIANVFATSLNALNEISNLKSFSFSLEYNFDMSQGEWNTSVKRAEAKISITALKTMASILMNVLIDAFSPDYKDFPIEQYSTISNTASNPLPNLYSRVEVIDVLGNTTLGETIQEFTSNLEYPVDVPNLAVPNSKKPRCATWLYGLPKNNYVKDASGNTLRKTESQFQYTKTTLTDNNFISRKWEAIFLTSDCSFTPINIGSPNCINQETYYPITGRIAPQTVNEYVYNNNGEFTTTSTSYEYNPSNYQVSKITTLNSKGEQIENRTYYSQDYTLTGPIQTLKDNNIYGAPVSSQTIIRKNGTQDYVVGGSVTEYGVLTNGDIKPIKTYSLRSENPVLLSSVAFNANQLIPNPTYYFETGTINYNTIGQPVQISSESGKACTLFDYDNKLPVATVTNADANDVSYTSFEAESNGNWGIADMSSVSTNENFLTGHKCYKFPTTGSSFTNSTLNTNKTYRLSFWSLGGLPNIYKGTPPNHNTSGIDLVKSYANNVTGWTYYEFNISSTSSFTIDNNLGGLTAFPGVIYLDELRLYPIDSRMTTYTYDPLIGKTSETDDNGRITYYEYDELGRLKTLRDEKRNVIKTYEYNYKQ